ncbi:MAG: DUF1016 N-terminal domain-containing protein [Ferruginibacter sp.]|nr:hypothetical protein [Ferruginibacter sp.]
MKQLKKTSKKIVLQESKKLYLQIVALINSRKENLNRSFNKELTMLNLQIGNHIDETLANTEENYGLEIVATLSPLLINQFRKGYTTSSLHRVRRFW